MDSDRFSAEAIELFTRYREDFGADDEESTGRQCEFESLFAILVCSFRGHELVPDHCAKYEHDYCHWCNVRRGELQGKILSDWRDKQ